MNQKQINLDEVVRCKREFTKREQERNQKIRKSQILSVYKRATK